MPPPTFTWVVAGTPPAVTGSALPSGAAAQALAALYGQDVSTFRLNPAGEPDLDPLGLGISGPRVLAEIVARRLSTPHGALMWDRSPGAVPVVIGGIPFDDPDFGYDLRQFVNAALSAAQLPAIEAGVQAECVKDPRIAGAFVRVALVDDGDGSSSLTVTITLTPRDPAGQPGPPFLLVLTADELQVAIQQLSSQSSAQAPAA